MITYNITIIAYSIYDTYTIHTYTEYNTIHILYTHHYTYFHSSYSTAAEYCLMPSKVSSSRSTC